MAKNNIRHYISLGGKIIGALVIGGPALQAAIRQTQGGGSLDRIPHDILYNYTGINSDGGSINFAQTLVGVGTIVGGLLLMKVFSYVARRF